MMDMSFTPLSASFSERPFTSGNFLSSKVDVYKRQVQGCEEMYVDMAKEMGVDYANEDPVVCDPASPKFMDAYFNYLHHPREAEGVDFWWIDWQQGSNCKVRCV